MLKKLSTDSNQNAEFNLNVGERHNMYALTFYFFQNKNEKFTEM